MKKTLYVLILIIITTQTGFSKGKTTEHKIKEVTGIAVGGASETLDQVKQKAINDAKINALKQAGIAENINAYTDYFRSETNNTMSELFASNVLSNINGTVKDIEIIKSIPTFTSEGQMKFEVTINCTVVKYNTTNDLAFGAWIDGINKIYKVGDGLSFTVKPTIECYIRVFIFTDESYVLLPNEAEKSNKLPAHTIIKFPDEKLINSYELTIADSKHEHETNRMVVLLLKEDIYYTGGINYKEITDWIMSIPPDERHIESFSFDIYR